MFANHANPPATSADADARSPLIATLSPTPLHDQAAGAADTAVRATQRLATEALDSLAAAVQALRTQAEPLLDSAGDGAEAVAHRGLDALRDGSAALRGSARKASAQTVRYIRDDPVRSMLFAAAAGAALMGMVSLMRSSPSRD